MKNIRVLLLSILLIVTGLIGFTGLQYYSQLSVAPSLEKSFSSLGEQIYFTGVGDSGNRISFSYGPMWLRMHGGSCVSCHGTDGKGSLPIMMSDEEAPSITWHALTEEEHEEDEHEEEEHPPYEEETVKRAIRDGLNPAGEEIDFIMPRWQMNEKELNSQIEFLKELE
jgi:cytochrome c oxidase subunit 2